MEVTTSMGAFTLELYAAQAPRTCANFLELARRGYYDGTVVRDSCSSRVEASGGSFSARRAVTHHPSHPPQSTCSSTALSEIL